MLYRLLDLTKILFIGAETADLVIMFTTCQKFIRTDFLAANNAFLR